MSKAKVVLEKRENDYLLSVHHEMGVLVTDMYFRCPTYRYAMVHEFENARIEAGSDGLKQHYGKRCDVNIYADAIQVLIWGEPKSQEAILFADEITQEGLKTE